MCAEMERMEGGAPELREANVLERSRLEKLAKGWNVSTVIHLAVPGRVVAPVALAPAMFTTAIEGTLNVLDSFLPRTLVLASTCAAYGNTPDWGAIAGKTTPQPVGLYGLSRTSCESLAVNWAAESGNTAIVLRIGNVIGKGCGGLIPYLVNHAVRYPDGDPPALLRGKGRIIRDYVPVSHVVRVMRLAANHDWRNVTQKFFNVGTSRGTSNGEIGAIVTRILATEGYKLQIQFTPEPGPGEARQAILDVNETTETFGVTAPAVDAVHQAVSEGVFHRLAQLTGESVPTASARECRFENSPTLPGSAAFVEQTERLQVTAEGLVSSNAVVGGQIAG